jgi:hypothetical protein
MITHKEFYVWLKGFMTNRDWSIIKQVDIESIQEKMKEVKDDFKLSDFTNLKQNIPYLTTSIKYRDDDDDLGKPPRIVM